MIRPNVFCAILLLVWTTSPGLFGCSKIGSAAYVFLLDSPSLDRAIRPVFSEPRLESLPGGSYPNHGPYFLRMIFYSCGNNEYKYELENLYGPSYKFLIKDSNELIASTQDTPRYRYDGFIVTDNSLFVATDANSYLAISDGSYYNNYNSNDLEFRSQQFRRLWYLEPLVKSGGFVISPLQFATGCKKKHQIISRFRRPDCPGRGHCRSPSLVESVSSCRRPIRVSYRKSNNQRDSKFNLFITQYTLGSQGNTYRFIRLITYSTPIIKSSVCPTTISNCTQRFYTPYETVAINIPNTQIYLQPKTIGDFKLHPFERIRSQTSRTPLEYIRVESKRYFVKHRRSTRRLMPSVSGMDIHEQSHSDLRMFKVHRLPTGIRLESVLYPGYYFGVLTSGSIKVPIFINVKQSNTILSDPSIKLDLNITLPRIRMAPYPIPNTPSVTSLGLGLSGSRPSGSSPSGSSPSGSSPSGSRPSGSSPSGSSPSGSSSSGSSPSGSRPSGSSPSGSRPSGSSPSGSSPSGLRPSGSRPSGLKPSGLRTSESLPSESSPFGSSLGSRLAAQP